MSDVLARGDRTEEYHTLLEIFVERHVGRARQRSQEWLDAKSTSIGGSEIAALMGMNPYSSFNKIVSAKAGINTWSGGSIACQWGTMFESIIERFVEIDCGTRLAGTDINIPAPEHSGLRGQHANSPDGYCVLAMHQVDGDWVISLTDPATQEIARESPKTQAMVLVEFKCPYSRQPDGNVPRQYKPQIWSGLALSPHTHIGMYVDAVFRKCSLWDLGPSADYDIRYHCEKKKPAWTTPVAWGLTGIYAPRSDAPREARTVPNPYSEFDTDLAYEAWRLHHEYFGIPFTNPKSPGDPFAPDPIDFGEGSKPIFEKMMSFLDRGSFRAVHSDPCFPDGRGSRLGTPAAIGAMVDDMARNPPPNHFLLGVLPWKVLEVDYAFLSRRPGFLEEVSPLVKKCLQLAAEIRLSANPNKAYVEYCSASSPPPKPSAAAIEEAQDLFDAL